MPLRLALYSDQRPPETDGLDQVVQSWLASGSRVGFLPSSPDPDRFWFESQRRHYERLGLELEFFGLEEEFEPSRLPDLLGCDAIHLTGGNTFRFLYWLRHRGLLEALRDFARSGKPLIGVSAGAILMTREVGSSLLCGDVPYEGISSGEGLGLVDFGFVPHFAGDRGRVEELANEFGEVVYAVADGGGLIIEGGDVKTFGQVLTLST